MVQASVSFAVATPHTSWIPERVASLDRLHAALGQSSHVTRVFSERESNRAWSRKLWGWACTVGASHLFQVQDDAVVMTDPWATLKAMVGAVPDQIIGLQAAHPMGPELARLGHRWYRTRAWVIGVAYVFPLDPKLPNGLPAFLEWCDAHPDVVDAQNEDTLINVWAGEHGFDVWHPIPTIVDHDLSVASVYGNEHHSHRRSTVTWRDVSTSREALGSVDYWTPPKEPIMVADPYAPVCWFCRDERGEVAYQGTGARIGRRCVAQAANALLTRGSS